MKKLCPKCGTDVEVEQPNEFTDSIGTECTGCGKLVIFRRGIDY